MQPVSKDIAYPIRYLMRTELGQGPLELLALRGFVLPSRIFADRAPTASASPASNQTSGLRPVP
jgi:type VI secretion system protein ImpL